MDMANCWLSLLLGVALLKGILSFGSIDVTDEEWIEYRNMLRDPNYRLPTTTRPSNYRLSLTPHFNGTNAFTFDGTVSITIRPTHANVNQIVLHCNDLTILSLTVTSTFNPGVNLTAAGQNFTCEMPYSFLRINTNTSLVLNQNYTITSRFRGNLQTNMRGFYRSWYVDNGGRKWMATTQFQPSHARQAFPCYDEPAFKATFDITITRGTDFSPTLSNMPIRETSAPVNGTVSETFYTTPLTSTYLVAFIVSHYRQVASNNNTVRPFHIYARNNINTTGDWSLRIGVPLLDVMERYTNISYYTMAPNMTMKQAAIPDFSSNAMENWGLLTYREALILYDPDNSNHFYRQRVANIVSHEITHMWFGNLVTCAWWDNLWLNEGFARFYQYYLTASVAPDMGFDTRFIVEQVHASLLSDSAATAHPLNDSAVNDPAAVSAHFSQITYGKGAAILRMTQYLLGNNTYVAGLRSYLKERQYNITEPHHLFTALDTAAIANNALSAYGGITIDRYFRSWSDKAGHPLLTVSVDHSTGHMTIIQTRFDGDSNETSSNSLWIIPITWTRGRAPEFLNLKPSQIINNTITIIDRGSLGREWVIFNKQQSGFYRVNYDHITWALITQALRSSSRQTIHEYNRAQIVDDVFMLARSGWLSYTRALNIFSFLKFENQYAPWIAATTGFNFALRRLAHNSTVLQRLKNEIFNSSTGVITRLGYNEPATGGIFMDDLLRMYVMTFLCNAGHELCISTARTSFQTWRSGGRIPANMRPWVYCTGLRYGNAQDFNYFWTRYLNENLASEKIVMINAAGCTGDQVSLHRFLAAIVSGNDDIRPQDYSAAISSAVTGNEFNTLRVFEWLKTNIPQTVITLGSINNILSQVTSRLLNENDISEVQKWLDDNRQNIGSSAYAAGTAGIADSRANILWYTQRVTEFNAYFETGYVEENFEPITSTSTSTTTTLSTTTPTTTTPTTTTPTTTTPTTTIPTTTTPTTAEPATPGPSSANIASLSIVTLIVTIVINNGLIFINYI